MKKLLAKVYVIVVTFTAVSLGLTSIMLLKHTDELSKELVDKTIEISELEARCEEVENFSSLSDAEIIALYLEAKENIKVEAEDIIVKGVDEYGLIDYEYPADNQWGMWIGSTNRTHMITVVINSGIELN